MLEEWRIKLKFYSLKKKTTLNCDMCVLICELMCVYVYVCVYVYIHICIINKGKLAGLPVEMLIYICLFFLNIFSRGSYQPRNWTLVSCIAGGFFTSWATSKVREYWSGWPVPSPADLPDPRIELESPTLQADSLPTELSGKHLIYSTSSLLERGASK